MFTPSFILIPAREIIPGKEIGLIAAWFTISQISAFIIPVILNWSISWLLSTFKSSTEFLRRENKKNDDVNYDRSRRASVATLAGVDYEKGISFSGGQKLGPIATGLSGVTATVIAPISHLPLTLSEDEKRHIESTVMEQARQQGDPAVTCTSKGTHHAHQRLQLHNFSPKSDVSSFEHHLHRHSSFSNCSPDGKRKGRNVRSKSHSPESLGARIKSQNRARPPMITTTTSPLAKESIYPDIVQSEEGKDHGAKLSSHAHANERKFQGIEEGDRGRSSLPRTSHIAMSPVEVTSSYLQKDDDLINPNDPKSGEVTAVNSRRQSIAFLEEEKGRYRKHSFDAKYSPTEKRFIKSVNIPEPIEVEPNRLSPDSLTGSLPVEEEEEDEDAVVRLSLWMSDLITPFIYFTLFIIGIPIYFVLNIALPLFMSINLLTFLAAITIVPPKIRRFLHPILSTSIATVLIIWAFAAMKGLGLKDCLNQFYSVDAKYSTLWSLSGYSGPIPGAGDILFSTLDAGIVALAVPMYRYRKELRENLARMLVILLPCAAMSLFLWSSIAHLMGMDAIRSLAFAPRFMSTPLAIELANNIGADESITVILVVITGVIAAILKEQFFYRLMRVKRDDFLTVGLTMGATSGAIGASSLISTPRTMAIASLSFVLFGTILLVATAIPPIVEIVRSLSGA